AAITRSGWVAAGRSLPECTARRARPSSTAAWICLTNTPLPPISQMGMSRRWSAVVSMTSKVTSTARPPARSAGRAPSSAATWSACQRASAEPRVAIGSASEPVIGPLGSARASVQVEQVAQGLGQPLAPGGAGGVLDADRGLVQELGDDALGERLDHFDLGRFEARELGAEAVELGPADGLGLV